MIRYRLDLAYHGADFCGWQSQPSRCGVQDVLQEAMGVFCRTPVTVHGAGRTDSGVHAVGQVAHVDLPVAVDPMRLLAGINALVKPRRVQVVGVTTKTEAFHARFCAVERVYRYVLAIGPISSIFWHERSWHLRGGALSVDRMSQAAELFVGRHDFSAFRSRQCRSHRTLRTIDSLTIEAFVDPLEKRSMKEGDARTIGNPCMLALTIKARAFLHRQVRMMVAALVAVGRGSVPLCAIDEALQSGTPLAVPLSPARGLTFVGVSYPDDAAVSSVYGEDPTRSTPMRSVE